MTIPRRAFMGRTFASSLAAGLGGVRIVEAGLEDAEESADSSEAPGLPIVDTHQHLWDLTKIRPPWLKSAGHLNRSHVTSDYLEVTRGLPIVQTVYMEVAVDPRDLVAEARYVLGLCADDDNPMCAAVIGGRPGSADFPAYIRQFKQSPYVKGVRHILPGGKDGQGLWSTASFISGIRLLGELGMRFDLCLPANRLPEATALVDACPETRFILDHCGNADPKASAEELKPWRRELARLAERDRVMCKISGIVARAPKNSWTADDLAGIVNHCLGVFGPDRVMFASDWPVCTRVATLREWVEALCEIVAARPEVERRKLFAENAIRFYDLDRS